MKLERDVTKPWTFKEATKETPINATIWTIIDAPARSVGAALAMLILAGLVVVGFVIGWPAGVPFVAAGSTGSLYLLWLIAHTPAVIYAVETITGHDLNRDGYVGEPPPPSEPWRIILEKDEGGELWLNFDSEELRQKAQLVAAFVLNGTPFSEKALSGTGRPLTRSEFYTLRDLFMFQGLVRWKDPKHPTVGLELTPLGRSTVRKLAVWGTTPPRIPAPRSQEYALPERVGEGE